MNLMNKLAGRPSSRKTPTKTKPRPVELSSLRRTINMPGRTARVTKSRANEIASATSALRKGNAVVVRSARPEVLDAIADFAAAVEKRIESDEAVIGALASSAQFPRAEHLEQLRRNAELRVRFVKEVPLLTSAGVAKLSGSAARNASAKASRWKSEGRIFSVTHGGIHHYPAFQFEADSGAPFRAMQDIIEVFANLSDWQIALWFIAPNAWLGNRAPLDAFARDPQAVIDAARQAVAPLEI
jgi:hypothetical protein